MTILTMMLCAAAMAAWVYRYDLYEKEPLRLVILAVLLGALAMWGAGQAEDYLLTRADIDGGNIALKVMIIALVEDSAKLAVVLAFAYGFRRHFNDPLDGIIYGTLAGLGAAVEESLLYLSLWQGGMATMGAEIIRLMAHSLMGGVIGFAAGLGVRRGGRRDPQVALTIGCVGLSLAFHFAWDLIAHQHLRSPAARASTMGLMLGLMMAWGWMVMIAARHSRRMFVNTQPVPNEMPLNLALSTIGGHD